MSTIRACSLPHVGGDLHIVEEEDGELWVAANEAADVCFGLSQHTFRKYLNELEWKGRKTERDPALLKRLCAEGVLSSPDGGLGHVRVVQLLQLEELPSLIERLKPSWQDVADAVRELNGQWGGRGRQSMDPPNVNDSPVNVDNEAVLVPSAEGDGESSSQDLRPEHIVDGASENVDEASEEPNHGPEEDIGDDSNADEVESSDDDLESDNSDDEEDDDPSFDPTAPSRPPIHHGKNPRHYALPKSAYSSQLRAQLDELRVWMTAPLRLDRQQGRFEEATVDNTQATILRLLGYVHRVHKVAKPDLTTLSDPTLFLKFLSWLLDSRGLLPKTLVTYLSACITGLKFVMKDQAQPHNQYAEIPLIGTLRDLRDQCQKLVMHWKPPTEVELERMKKCLPWPQIVNAAKTLMERYQAVQEDGVEKARALQKYLMVAFFIYFPPVRGGPIRQLKIGQSLVLTKEDGWILDARKFKTFGRYGPQPTPLHSQLIAPVELFVKTERARVLQGQEDHGFFFVNELGLPYTTASSWTKALQAIFKDVTGVPLSNNLLRHSFVTFVHSSNASDALKQSVAQHMGHTVETARQQYNVAFRQQGLEFAAEVARGLPEFGEEGASSSAHPEEHGEEAGDDLVDVNDVLDQSISSDFSKEKGEASDVGRRAAKKRRVQKSIRADSPAEPERRSRRSRRVLRAPVRWWEARDVLKYGEERERG